MIRSHDELSVYRRVRREFLPPFSGQKYHPFYLQQQTASFSVTVKMFTIQRGKAHLNGKAHVNGEAHLNGEAQLNNKILPFRSPESQIFFLLRIFSS
jgi:hypothetical protein